MNLFQLFDQVADLNTGQRADFMRELAKSDAKRADQLERMLQAEKSGELPEPDKSALLKTAQMIQPATAPAMGDKFGSFTLQSSLGRGGMGEVWLATREAGSAVQQVALKILRVDLRQHEARLRFELEQRLIASLSHPNVARLIDAGKSPDGSPWIALEYVDGASISDWCVSRRLGVRARVQLMLKVLGAVSHAHEHLIVHRDLKSSNVMVTNDGDPKLLDFGIAKVMGDTQTTATAQRFFSLGSVAPEQYTGERTTVATDIYQLGVLLYELLTGVAPYELDGLSPAQIQAMILDRPPELPSRAISAESAQRGGLPKAAVLSKTLQGDLDRILMYALRKNPTERYRSTHDFARDLQAYLDGLPVLASGQSALYRMRKFLRRHWLPASLVAVTTLSLFALLAQLLMRDAVLTKAREDAISARDVASLERDKARDINGFLLDLFRAASPTASVKKDLPSLVSDAIALELQRQKFQADPNIAIALGKAAIGLGQLDQARALLAALEAFVPSYSLDERRQVQFLQAHLANIEANYDRLSQINRELAKHIASASTEQQVVFIGYVGQTLVNVQPERVLKITALKPLPTQLVALRTRALSKLKRHAEAAALLQEALASNELTPAERLGSMQWLVWALRAQDKSAEALQISTELTALARTQLGANNVRLVPYLNTHAVALEAVNQIDAACAVYDEILTLADLNPKTRSTILLNRVTMGTKQDPITTATEKYLTELMRDWATHHRRVRAYLALSDFRIRSTREFPLKASKWPAQDIDPKQLESVQQLEFQSWLWVASNPSADAQEISARLATLAKANSRDVQLRRYLRRLETEL